MLSRILGTRKPVPCPRCQMQGAESRGPMVVPFDDGSEKRIGRLYGCPHCGLAWFLQEGSVRLFGHAKASLNQHPAQWTPPAEQVRKTEKDDDKPLRDSDLPWR